MYLSCLLLLLSNCLSPSLPSSYFSSSPSIPAYLYIKVSLFIYLSLLFHIPVPSSVPLLFFPPSSFTPLIPFPFSHFVCNLLTDLPSFRSSLLLVQNFLQFIFTPMRSIHPLLATLLLLISLSRVHKFWVSLHVYLKKKIARGCQKKYIDKDRKIKN